MAREGHKPATGVYCGVLTPRKYTLLLKHQVSIFSRGNAPEPISSSIIDFVTG